MKPIKEIKQENPGLYLIIARIILSCLGLFGTMCISENHFEDTYTANICLYIIFVTVLEMILQVRKNMGRARFYSYLGTLLLMVFFGYLLVSQSSDFVNHPVAVNTQQKNKMELDKTETPMIVLNAEDRITIANKAAMELGHYEQKGVIGYKASHVFPKDRHMYRAVAGAMIVKDGKRQIDKRTRMYSLEKIRFRKADGNFVQVKAFVVYTPDDQKVIHIIKVEK